MVNKFIILGLTILLFGIIASLDDCSSATTIDRSTTDATSYTAIISTEKTPTDTTSAATASTPTTSNQTDGTLAEILGRVCAIDSMKYDMVTTTPDNQTLTYSMWVKKRQIRMEITQQGQNVLIIINGNAKVSYSYIPTQNMAIKEDFSQVPELASTEANSILQYTPTVVGTDTIDGKLCLLIQYTDNGMITKEWIWEEKGLPVRIQSTTSHGTSTKDYINYDFSDIPDSMFQLPVGAQISSLGSASGIPTSFPTGIPTNWPTALPTNLLTGLPTITPSH